MTRRTLGFTLIEVMVALSLLAFALALTFGTLRGATRATGQAEQTARRDERLRAVQGFLRTQLNGALPIAFAIDPATGEATFLRADEHKLEFVATMPGYLSRGGPYLQSLEFVPGEHGKKLVFQHRMLMPEGPLEPEREPEVLLDGLSDGRFEFRALDDKGAPGPWQPEWNMHNRLPPLARIRLRFEDEQRHWPDFVVALRLGVVYGLGAPTLAAPVAADSGGSER